MLIFKFLNFFVSLSDIWKPHNSAWILLVAERLKCLSFMKELVSLPVHPGKLLVLSSWSESPIFHRCSQKSPDAQCADESALESLNGIPTSGCFGEILAKEAGNMLEDFLDCHLGIPLQGHSRLENLLGPPETSLFVSTLEENYAHLFCWKVFPVHICYAVVLWLSCMLRFRDEIWSEKSWTIEQTHNVNNV